MAMRRLGALGGLATRCALQQGPVAGARFMASQKEKPQIAWHAFDELLANSPVPLPKTKIAIAQWKEEFNKLDALCDESTVKPIPLIDVEEIMKGFPNDPDFSDKDRKELEDALHEMNDPVFRAKLVENTMKESSWRKDMEAEVEKYKKVMEQQDVKMKAWAEEGERIAKELDAKEAKIKADIANLRTMTIADVLKDNPEWEKEINEEIMDHKWNY